MRNLRLCLILIRVINILLGSVLGSCRVRQRVSCSSLTAILEVFLTRLMWVIGNISLNCEFVEDSGVPKLKERMYLIDMTFRSIEILRVWEVSRTRVSQTSW